MIKKEMDSKKIQLTNIRCSEVNVNLDYTQQYCKLIRFKSDHASHIDKFIYKLCEQWPKVSCCLLKAGRSSTRHVHNEEQSEDLPRFLV